MGQLFVVTGPSGAGKREVLERSTQMGFDFFPIVSYTTRDKREEEVEGEDYKYISRKNFQDMIDKDEMLEWTEVHKNMYGTKNSEVDEALRSNEKVFIEVDPTGARKIKEKKPEAIVFFIMPPSYENLKKRLKDLSEDELKARIDIGKKELEKLLEWDYLIVFEDDKIDQAVSDLIKNVKENL